MLQRFVDLETADVDPRTIAHAETCPVCSERIAEAALATLRVHELVLSAAALADEVPDAAPVAARTSAPSPALPLLIAVLVAALASMPLATDWVSRTAHFRLLWEASVRMFEPLWAAVLSPGVHVAATAAAVVLCFIIVLPLARQSQLEVKS